MEKYTVLIKAEVRFVVEAEDESAACEKAVEQLKESEIPFFDYYVDESWREEE